MKLVSLNFIFSITISTILFDQIPLTTSQKYPAVPRFLGKIALGNVAYVEVFEDHKGSNGSVSDHYTLFLSTFNAYNSAKDPKYYLRSPGDKLDSVSDWQFKEIDVENTAFWPNNPDFMPQDIAGTEGVVWTSGFLVPAKKKGALELYDTVSDPPVGPFIISAQDTETWSYHRVIWKDMDGDGDRDALTARFNVLLTGGIHTQLAWLENPGVLLAETPTSGWTQHILQDSNENGALGLDVHFRNFQITSAFDGATYDCILAAEFWNEQLALYYINISNGLANWSQVTRIEIDTELGQVFDVFVDDFNRDGKIDLMATAYNHPNGGVYVWEIPENFPSDLGFKKHTIADGFTAAGGQYMTPGSPNPFYPSKAFEEDHEEGRQRKPYILLSGDDDGKHYILEPMSEVEDDWVYKKHVLIDTEMTTSGKHAAVDLDGDGYTEIIAAGYTAGQVYVFTYAP